MWNQRTIILISSSNGPRVFGWYVMLNLMFVIGSNCPQSGSTFKFLEISDVFIWNMNGIRHWLSRKKLEW